MIVNVRLRGDLMITVIPLTKHKLKYKYRLFNYPYTFFIYYSNLTILRNCHLQITPLYLKTRHIGVYSSIFVFIYLTYFRQEYCHCIV